MFKIQKCVCFHLKGLIWLVILSMDWQSCSRQSEQLRPVTVSDFRRFTTASGYLTDAERFGWSIVQVNVFEFRTVEGASWRLPDGEQPPAADDLPVTQVSYNDALAYCRWTGSRLPTYEEYWTLTAQDRRRVVYDNNGPISPVDSVNLRGNVWELTAPEQDGGPVRLAGGSLFCSENTCHGLSRERELYVDTETGNIHIGFCVLQEAR
jgi:hypothetical protein